MTKKKPMRRAKTTEAPPANGGAVLCVCGRAGTYAGCVERNKVTMLVAFKCDCGEVWNFHVSKDELARYRS
jgi:hypothetical protein